MEVEYLSTHMTSGLGFSDRLKELYKQGYRVKFFAAADGGRYAILEKEDMDSLLESDS
jgi:hypothetical protein